MVVSFQQYYVLIFMLILLLSTAEGKTWELSKQCSFGYRGTMDRRVLSHCFSRQWVNFNLENVWFMLTQISKTGQRNALINEFNKRLLLAWDYTPATVMLQLTMQYFECFYRRHNLNCISWRKKDVKPHI
jgi:hypothetical protein